MSQSTQPEPQSPASKYISKVSVLWKLTRVVPLSFAYTQNDFVGEHPFFRKYIFFFLQKSIFSVEAVDSPPFTLECCHFTVHCTSVQLPAPASLCLRTFSGHKNPLCSCTGQTRTPRIKSPLPSSPQSMPNGNWVYIPPALSTVSQASPMGLSPNYPKVTCGCPPFHVFPSLCFLGSLPQQTIYTWFLVSGTAYGRIWTKTVIFLNLFF